MPPAAQVKLLRAIQEGQVDPVGGRKPIKVDVRIISATNRNLIADVTNGRFREDLFYRLHVFPITVPPLRERPEDIPELVRHFLVRFAAEEGKRIRAVSADALGVLNAHPWPGNVRQLENAVFRAVVLADGDEVGAQEFPQLALAATRVAAPAIVPAGSQAPQHAAPQPTPLILDEVPSAPAAPPPVAAGDVACAHRRRRPRPAAGRDRGRGDSIGHRALSRADVRGRAPVAHRPLDSLPQAGRNRDRRRRTQRTGGENVASG